MKQSFTIYELFDLVNIYEKNYYIDLEIVYNIINPKIYKSYSSWINKLMLDEVFKKRYEAKYFAINDEIGIYADPYDATKIFLTKLHEAYPYNEENFKYVMVSTYKSDESIYVKFAAPSQPDPLEYRLEQASLDVEA